MSPVSINDDGSQNRSQLFERDLDFITSGDTEAENFFYGPDLNGGHELFSKPEGNPILGWLYVLFAGVFIA